MRMRMVVQFHPQRSNAQLKLEKEGATLIVNGERFDFSELGSGATLPAEAIKNPFFVGPVRRQENIVYLDILLPIGDHANRNVRFPRSVAFSDDGPMRLPTWET